MEIHYNFAGVERDADIRTSIHYHKRVNHVKSKPHSPEAGKPPVRFGTLEQSQRIAEGTMMLRVGQH